MSSLHMYLIGKNLIAIPGILGSVVVLVTASRVVLVGYEGQTRGRTVSP